MSLSVLMCVYKEPIKIVDLAIQSILNQTYDEFEFIIVNDNPSSEELDKYLKDLKKIDGRIKVVKNKKNIGLQNSLNVGLNNCTRKYVARMDADDISLPNRFELQRSFIEEKNAQVVATNYAEIDENGHPLEWNLAHSLNDRNIEQKLLIKNVIAHPSVMFEKKIIQELGGYREINYAEDYDLWLRVLSAGYKIRYLKHELLLYRIHKNSISNANKIKQFITSIYVQNLFLERVKHSRDNFSKSSQDLFISNYEKAASELDLENQGVKNKLGLYFSNKFIRKYYKHKIKMILKSLKYLRIK